MIRKWLKMRVRCHMDMTSGSMCRDGKPSFNFENNNTHNWRAKLMNEILIK
jgi:hypothetical protein